MNKFKHTIHLTSDGAGKEEVAIVAAQGDAIIIRDYLNTTIGGSTLKYSLETTQELFEFKELSEVGQQKAIEKLYDINVNHDWWNCIYYEAKELGFKITGFGIERSSFCDIDTEEDVDDIMRNILKSHGETCDTFIMATEYWDERDNLVNKYSTQKPEVVDDDKFNEFDEEEQELNEEYKERLSEEYLSLLRKEYEHLTSEEAIEEAIEANEYMFDESGEIV